MISFVGVRGGEAYRVELIGAMLLTGCVAMVFCVRKFWRGHGNGRVYSTGKAYVDRRCRLLFRDHFVRETELFARHVLRTIRLCAYTRSGSTV